MRVLFCSAPGSGHVNPLLPVARSLSDLGHEVRFLVPPEAAAGPREAGFHVDETAGPDPVRTRELGELVQSDPAAAMKIFFPEFFGRLCTASMLAAATEYFETWRPDLVLHESAEFGSPIAAQRAGIRHLQVAISPASTMGPMLRDRVSEVLEEFDSGVVDYLVASPFLSRLPESFDPSVFPQTVRYRDPSLVPTSASGSGSALNAEQAAALAELTADDSTRLVYATLGSETGRMPWAPAAYRILLDAFTLLENSYPDVRVLLTTGRKIDPASLGAVPGNTRVLQWFPQEVAFEAASAVVGHAGGGTSYGALGVGLPSVYVPLFADQPNNAKLLAEAGVGIEIDTSAFRENGFKPDLDPAERARFIARAAADIVEALAAVLDKPQYAESARRLGEEFNALPSVADALAPWLC